MTGDDRLRTPPKERLAPPVQLFNLANEVAKLRAEPHPAVSGHRQVVLVRRGPVSIILFVFDANGLMKDHKAEGEVTIHVINGQLDVTVENEVHTLKTGMILSMAPGEPHALHARYGCEMLLTVCQVPD